MADFVAVIRRTVDGLSDNVPDMRSKVYEKARGAVRRQLENMKPRPSDDMIERQMVKLEAAIAEVESDYAEALPELDEADLAPEAAIFHEPMAEEPEVVEPEAAYEAPAQSEPAVEPEPEPEHQDEQAETYAEHEPVENPEAAVVAESDAVDGYVEPDASVEPQPESVEEVQPVSHEATLGEAASIEPISEEPDTAWQEPEPLQAPEQVVEEYSSVEDQHVYPEETAVVASELEPEVDAEVAQPESAEEDVVADETSAAPSEEPWHDPAAFEPVEVPHVEEPVVEAEAPAAGSEWDLPEWEQQPAPVAASAVVEPVWNESAVDGADGRVIDLADYMPPEPVADGEAVPTTEPSHSWEWDDSDPFQQSTAPAQPEGSEPAISDWSWPVEKPAATEASASLPAAHWDDIDRLLDNGEPAAAAAVATPSVPDPEAMAAPARPMSYRAEPKKSGSILKTAGIAAVVLLALGGSSYAYWLNRDAVNQWVSETIASVTASAPVATTSETPQTTEPATQTPEANTQTPSQPQTDVASLDSNSTKFTQRLQADGTESDSGPAPLPTGDATSEAEGKSVAAQTEAGTPVAQAETGTVTDPAAGQTPTTGTAQAPASAEVQIPEGAQKMFLYEERLGQSSPTAIEGTVAWSMKEESPGNDAPPEPTIQAQINVPERGLTALMTIKRNTDPSLPASHVVEFVFSLPENFEGGAIESVQRVSMKQNEQARGDPLIAVPAKITDDFHMIALNDYPEAVATNTELLRNRSWIDVPLTYRNGRRALLTLEKGPVGTEAFTKALQAWSRAPATSGQ